MKNKLRKVVVVCLAAFVLLTGVLPVSAQENTRTVGEAQSFIDGIVAYNLKSSGASSVQQWINGSITKNAGVSSEWYAIALSQNGNYDFSSYKNALLNYLAQNEVYSASSRQKYALALVASGSTDSYIYNTLNDSIGQQGVMSWTFGLHLLNNGYSSNSYSLSSVKQKLLSLQLSDGGWAVTGSYSDVDATAMAVQALAPYYHSDSSVKSAIDKALTLLSNRQQATGDYASYGVGNLESTAQVLVALSTLGIDSETDNRFIKNGKTLFDGISLYQLSDGSFCHQQGGGSNGTATVQVFYSMVSYLRMKNGQSGLYILDARNPAGLQIPDNSAISNAAGATSSGGQSAANQTGENSASVINSSQTTTNQNKGESDTDSAAASSDGSEGTVTDNQTEDKISEAGGKKNATTDDTSVTGKNDNATLEQKNSTNYKLWVSLGIAIIAGAICLILYFLKKRNLKNYIAILVVAAVAIFIVLATNFQTTEEYYKNADTAKDNAIGKVTLTIRCDTIVGKSEEEYVPDDGIILDVTEIEIEEGDTVYDILLEAAGKNKIHLETSGSGTAIYVEGINHIYEMDYGDLSGWMYLVNDKEPSVGCGEYKVSVGDEIEWLYTCELGKDLE
ncbi:MAG: DUF4430 domain-containing protein [Tyzzerella sp.]|nr:DUF4430 domain-containing protein [Tyzzerella sp.]